MLKCFIYDWKDAGSRSGEIVWITSLLRFMFLTLYLLSSQIQDRNAYLTHSVAVFGDVESAHSYELHQTSTPAVDIKSALPHLQLTKIHIYDTN